MMFNSIERANIYKEYREAKDPLAQIRIMADLYACKVQDIKAALEESGVNPDEMDMRKKSKKAGSSGGSASGKYTSKVPGALAALRDELKCIDKRENEIPGVIENLERELEQIKARKTTVVRVIDMLKEVIV